MLGALFILQTGAAVAAARAADAPSQAPPTIELHARVHADRIRIERRGESHLTVTADPLLERAVDARSSKPLPNAQTVKNVDVNLDVHVTVDPNGGPPAVTAQLSSTPGEHQP